MIHTLKTMFVNWRLLRNCIAGCFIVVVAGGCASAQRVFRSQVTLDEANLAIQVEPTDESGQYTISGMADLPQGTELTVAAVRYLHLTNVPLKAGKLNPTYSILAYDTVKVRDDRWQTELSLWQVAPNGEFMETWQIDEPELQLSVEPQEEVIFLVSLAPIHNLRAIEQQLARENQQFARRFIQTSAEGSRYLQTGELLEIDLPTGSTTPLAIRPEDINGGWGKRYLQLPDLPNTRQLEFPENRQTNAPISNEEMLY
ncbi:MAG: hypothetical protein F6K42_10180 [Leptolyngbya sp. SIO1D8]|nr:hypothetical protein [Leptolyngbya sp. SIO1D8]